MLDMLSRFGSGLECQGQNYDTIYCETHRKNKPMCKPEALGQG